MKRCQDCKRLYETGSECYWCHRELSADTQPKVAMPIKTKCERVQPFVVGIDKNGQLKWVGLEMPDWQKLLLRVRYAGDFAAHWFKRQLFELTGIESDQSIPSADVSQARLYGQAKPRKHKSWGD